MSDEQITDRTPQLLSGIDSLESVAFDRCAALTNDGIAALARLPKLSELGISEARVAADVADAFPPSVRVRYSL